MEITLYWRKHPVVGWIRNVIRDNTCGELCSLRFTWQRPKKFASGENVFLYETFAAALDGAGFVAEAPLKQLVIEKVPGMNILFGMAYFTNGIATEFELNECLPDTMPDVCFLKANFSHGHLTNQPIVGHFNEEGMVVATDEVLEYPIAESFDCPPVNGPIEQMKLRYRLAPVEADGSELIQWIKEALS